MEMKKSVSCLVIILMAMLFSVTNSFAAGYPEKPVNLVVCFAAGGETDIVVRALNDKLTANLGGP
ncbi:MAG: tripartite tricarboxylate transporter substrate binding protein, partial [Desulfobacteraceae bacterium]